MPMLWKYKVDTWRMTLFGKAGWPIGKARHFPFLWLCRLYAGTFRFDDGRQWNRFLISKAVCGGWVEVGAADPPTFLWEDRQ